MRAGRNLTSGDVPVNGANGFLTASAVVWPSHTVWSYSFSRRPMMYPSFSVSTHLGVSGRVRADDLVARLPLTECPKGLVESVRRLLGPSFAAAGVVFGHESAAAAARAQWQGPCSPVAEAERGPWTVPARWMPLSRCALSRVTRWGVSSQVGCRLGGDGVLQFWQHRAGAGSEPG